MSSNEIKQTPITELVVHSFEPESYNTYKRYLERQDVEWLEERNPLGQLTNLRLRFPEGTIYIAKFPGQYEVQFPRGGLIVWYIHDLRSSFSIPSEYLKEY